MRNRSQSGTKSRAWEALLYSVARAEHVEMDRETAAQIGQTGPLGALGY